jgi:hypothetical protein
MESRNQGRATEQIYGRLVTGNTYWYKSPTAENIFCLWPLWRHQIIHLRREALFFPAVNLHLPDDTSSRLRATGIAPEGVGPTVPTVLCNRLLLPVTHNALWSHQNCPWRAGKPRNTSSFLLAPGAKGGPAWLWSPLSLLSHRNQGICPRGRSDRGTKRTVSKLRICKEL